MKKTILFIAILNICCGIAVHASDVNEDDIFHNVSLEDLLGVKVKVATKSEESVTNSASSVTVFSKAEIKRLGIYSLEDLLRYVPGFYVSREIQQGSTYRIGVRGTSTPLNEEILFLVNGQRLNDLYSGGATLLNRNIAVNNVEQIEIIRGPGSALYGSNAFLGVINIITKKDNTDAAVAVGEQNLFHAGTNFSQTLKNGTKVYGNVNAFDEQGHEFTIEDGFAILGTTRDPRSGRDILLGVKKGDLTLDMRHMNRRNTDGIPFGGFGEYVNSEQNSQDSITAQYDYKINENFSTQLNAGFKKDYWKIFYQVLPAAVMGAAPFYGGPLIEGEAQFLNWDFRYTPPIENNELLAGASYERSRFTDIAIMSNYIPSTVMGANTPTASGGVETFRGSENFVMDKANDARTVTGFYLQDTQKFSYGLKAVVGVRNDHYSDFGSSTNPRASIVWETSWRGTFKAIYGEAFRAPSYLELYDQNNPVDAGNPDLDPEKVKTTEFVYVQSWDKGEASITFFQNNIKDKIELGPGFPGQWGNTGTAKPQGFELYSKFGIANNITVNGQYSHVTSDESILSPKSVASVILNYNRDDWNYNVSANYHSEISYTPTAGVQDTKNKLEAKTLYNISAMRSLGSGIMVQGTVLNLLDEDNNSLGQTGSSPFQFPNRGREILLSLRKDY